MSQERLVEMFTQVVVKKDASLIQTYFHPGFVLQSNGRRQALAAFLRHCEFDYATSVTYEIHFDEHAWVTSAGAVGARFWLTVRRPSRLPEVTENIVLANFVGDRIHRMWELCWPSKQRRGPRTSPRAAVGRSLPQR